IPTTTLRIPYRSATILSAALHDIDLIDVSEAPSNVHKRRTRKAMERQLNDKGYPILTLPPEITAEIFLHCVQASGSNLSPVSASHAPMLLLRICRAWRLIALSTPALWTDLNLHSGWVDLRRWQELEGRISEWTSRACDAPLSLAFRDPEGEIPPERMSALLRQYAARLGSLTLETLLTTLAALSDIGPLPLLQRLTLKHYLEDEAPSVRVFRDAPQLREVVLEGGSMPTRLVLPWHQLTTFAAKGASVADGLFVLRSAPRLTTCTFLNMLEGIGDEHERVTHASLMDLSLSNGAGAIIQYLDLPALRDLSLKRLAGAPLSALLEFFSRCAPTLRRFEWYPALRARGLISVEWFRTMTRLTDINLQWVGEPFQRAFVNLLNRQRNSGFLPDLRTVEMRCDSYDVDAELVDTLASRSDESGGVKLASFSMIFGSDGSVPPLQRDALLELVARGMKIHIGPT
ncbi:hypothetical protein FB451DRAFT_676321, partial [Mycena latifolia]